MTGDNGLTFTCNVCGCTATNVCTHIAEVSRLREDEKRFGKYIADSAAEFRQMRQDRDDAQAQVEMLGEDVSRVHGWHRGCRESRSRWRGMARDLLEKNRKMRKASAAIEAIRNEIATMRRNVQEAIDCGDGALLDEARTGALEAIDGVIQEV